MTIANGFEGPREYTRARAVIQVGPGPDSPGGMASVIEELLRLELVNYKLTAAPTWGRHTGVASLLTAGHTAIRLVLGRRHWDIAHVHVSEYGSFFREGAILLLCKLIRKPVVITLHGAQLFEHAKRFPRLTKIIFRSADHIFCLGKKQQALVNRISPAVSTSIIMNPISDKYLIGEGELHSGALNTPTYCFAGEVGYRKGFDRLIAAWEHVIQARPDASLLVAGPLADGFQVAELSGVNYLGILSRADVQLMYRRCLISVLPSRAEVLPMTVLESLASGTPALLTKVGEWENFKDCPSVQLLNAAEVTECDLIRDLAQSLLRAATPGDDDVGGGSVATRWVQEHAGAAVVASDLKAVYDQLPKTERKTRYLNRCGLLRRQGSA